MPLPLPSLTTQRRIADVLDQVEQLRAQRRRVVAQLDSLAQSIFLETFGDPMKGTKNWATALVSECGAVQLGRQRAPKYQTGLHTKPYVRVANVFEDYIDTSDIKTMDFDDKDYEAYRLEAGDILLNEGQSTELVGRPAMWRNEIEGCCFQNTLVRFKADRSIVDPTFALGVFLRYFRTGEFARISSKTSSVAHLGASRFAAMPFPVPPLRIQQEYAAQVNQVTKARQRAVEHLALFDELLATLQRRAFQGELWPDGSP